jgi:NNP family nitrate/nitrite transporter-like MFS transporter
MVSYGIIAALDRMCLPVLFKEISLDLDLSLVSIGTIWGMDPLAGMFISLPSGLLADRFGLKRTMTVVCILAGIFSALRAFSNSFFSLAAAMFFFGLMAAITPAITPKVTAVWFSRRYLGLTNALLNVFWYVCSITATMLSATFLSPALGGWRNTILVLSAPAVVMGLLWLITGREPDKSQSPTASARSVPFRQAFSKVIRNKEVWFVGLIEAAFFGSNTGFYGYLPLYLRNIGWPIDAADTAITLVNGACLIGIFPMVLLANRLRSNKVVLIVSLVAMSANLFLLPFLQGNTVFVLLAISGFLRGGGLAILTVMIFDIKGIGSTYAGTAVGLATSCSMGAAFIAPPVGNSLASINPGMPFIFWGILPALSIALLFFIKGGVRSQEEVGEKASTVA